VGPDPVHRVEFGRHIDDAAPAPVDHFRCDAAREAIGREVVGGDHVVDDLVADHPEALQAVPPEPRRVDIGEGEPGIVDQNVDPAEALAALGDDAVAFVLLAQIGDERVEALPGSDFFRLRCDLSDIALDMTDRDHRMPSLRQAKAHRPAEPAQPAGDQRDPALAIIGHDSPPT
jgi:hypothetical protein